MAAPILLLADDPAVLPACATRIALAGSGPESSTLIERIGERAPALLLIDAEAATLARAICRRLHATRPDLPLLLLAEIGDVDEAQGWLQLGVRGFVARRADSGLVQRAVAAILAGELWLSRALMTGLLTRMLARPDFGIGRSERAVTTWPAALTGREQDIVDAASAGLSNREIAARFGIGECTVKTHLHHAFEKMNLVRRSQLPGQRAAAQPARA